ncbi:MAG: AbrB family transcriptional regulator [Eubacteriales bacterium]|nr:AbrB family transcriptional regulator [Eubacteriales bacterium]
MEVILTLLVAFAAGFLFMKFKVPGGMMIGAVLGSCAFNIITGDAQMPSYAKTVAQIVAGAFIGSSVEKKDLKQMKSIFKIAAFVIGSYFIMNVICGFFIMKTGRVDPLTALLSCAPGGLSDIPIIADDMGADSSKVLVLQFVRYLLGLGVFPSLLNLIPNEQCTTSAEKCTVKKTKKPINVPNTVLTFAVAGVAGLIGKYLKVPGGTMAFATIGAVTFKCFCPKAEMHRSIRKAAQLLSGAYVGSTIGMAQLIDMKRLALPAVVLIVVYTLGAAIMGTVLYRRMVFKRREAYLASIPAGASDMALISDDLGIHNIKIVLLQVMRMIVVISIFPTLLKLIAQLFSSIF